MLFNIISDCLISHPWEDNVFTGIQTYICCSEFTSHNFRHVKIFCLRVCLCLHFGFRQQHDFEVNPHFLLYIDSFYRAVLVGWNWFPLKEAVDSCPRNCDTNSRKKICWNECTLEDERTHISSIVVKDLPTAYFSFKFLITQWLLAKQVLFCLRTFSGAPRSHCSSWQTCKCHSN